MSLIRTGLLGLLGLALAGCAQVPLQMAYFPDAAAPDTAQVWPPAPEVPRYQYAGQLRGDANFSAVQREQPGRMVRLLRFLVGLAGLEAPAPRRLLRPQSGMVDASGRILVTDIGHRALFVFDPVGAGLSLWSLADAGASFMEPIGVAQDRDGGVLVSDAGLRRVVRLNAKGEPVSSFGEGVLTRPTGIASDLPAGRVFVADTGAHNIKVFDLEGQLLDVLGARGLENGQFNAPTHLAWKKDRLYVSDTLNARVQILEASGDAIGAFGRRGLYLGNLTRPKGVAADADGNVYVVESYYDHLLVFDAQGHFLLPIGGTGNGVGQFFLPAGIWADGRGRIFVADMYNGRVIIFKYLGD